MIKPGTICIWQNVVGEYSWLNGTECTAKTGLQMHKVLTRVEKVLGYLTDTKVPYGLFQAICLAKPHELREKNPPKEEETTTKEKEIENV
jgi:hypothetical protein